MSPVRSEATMEFLRGVVVQSAINTLTEVEVPVPASANENLAVLIHKIQVAGEFPNAIAANVTHIREQLSKRSVAGLALGYNDPDLLWRINKVIDTTAVGDVQFFMGGEDNEMDWSPPILIARDKLYFSIDSGNLTGVKGVTFAIGYTLQKVTPDVFIAALVS